MNRLLGFTALIITLSSSILSADVSGKVIAFNCYGCHSEGLRKLSQSQDLSQDQLLTFLLNFKRDTQASSVMNRISKGYTDYELESVAAYIKNTLQKVDKHGH